MKSIRVGGIIFLPRYAAFSFHRVRVIGITAHIDKAIEIMPGGRKKIRFEEGRWDGSE